MSRMRPQPFNGKQGFLLSASPSVVGGNRGLWALRVPLEHRSSEAQPGLKKQWVEFLGEKPTAETDRVETNDTEAA
jgi:hypothetical protein